MSYEENRRFNNYLANTEKCPDCNGKGKIGYLVTRDSPDCETCNGKGRIRKYVQLDPIGGRFPLQKHETNT